jgi:hypothetical protein
MGGSCAHRFSFIQSFDERGRAIWTLAEKKFELCEKARPEQLSRVQNQKAEHFYRPCRTCRTYLGKNALGF